MEHACPGGSCGRCRSCRSWYGKETLLEVEDQKAWRDGHGSGCFRSAGMSCDLARACCGRSGGYLRPQGADRHGLAAAVPVQPAGADTGANRGAGKSRSGECDGSGHGRSEGGRQWYGLGLFLFRRTAASRHCRAGLSIGLPAGRQLVARRWARRAAETVPGAGGTSSSSLTGTSVTSRAVSAPGVWKHKFYNLFQVNKEN